MSGRAALMTGVLAAAAVVGVRPAPACDAVAATAGLARGVCALESDPEGVRARGCGEAPATWTIAAPPVAKAAVAGTAGGNWRGATVDVALSDGASQWLGLSERRECEVRPRGLVRYDRVGGEVHAFRGTDSGPCGFLVHDLLLRDDTLWVATDLGVSRRRMSSEDWDEWTHYTASPDGAALEETSCGSVMGLVAEAASAAGGEEIGRWLAEFRPRFVKRSRRGMRPASREVRRWRN